MALTVKPFKYFYFLGVIYGAVPPINFTTLKLQNSAVTIAYRLFLGLLYIGLYSVSIWKRFDDVYPFTPNITDTILDFASYTSMTITSLVFVINNNFIQPRKIEEFFRNLVKVDRSLSNNTNHHGNENEFTSAVIKSHESWFWFHVPLLFFILLLNLFYVEIFWTVTITFEANSGYTASNVLKTQSFIMAMIIYNLLLSLKQRFVYLNAKLTKIDVKVHVMKDVFVIGDNSRERDTIEKLNRIHKQLLLMCADLNEVFGNPVLFLCITFTVSILHPINSALCQVMKGNVFDGVEIPNFGLHYVIMSVLSAFNSMVLVVPLAHASYAVVRESQRAPTSGLVLAKKLSIFEYSDDVHKMAERLRSWGKESSERYPIFTASSFYNVDHTMLLTLFGSVSTYLIVLIQLNMMIDGKPLGNAGNITDGVLMEF